MDDAVKAAIKKMTDHIRKWSHQTAWDWGYDPTPEEIEDRKSKIDNICDVIDALGDREKLTVGEFESVRQTLVDSTTQRIIE
jgi:adenine-specific DNA methylase